MAGSGKAPRLPALDIVMVGLSRLEVTRRLRPRPETAKCPIVKLSRRDSGADILAGWQSGDDSDITKPLMLEQLNYFINSTQTRRRLRNHGRTRSSKANCAQWLGCRALGYCRRVYIGGGAIVLILIIIIVVLLLRR